MKITALLTAGIVLTIGINGPVYSIDANLYRLEQDNKVERKYATRIDREKMKKCQDCDQKAVLSKFKYMERVVSDNNSSDYQRVVESKIFTEAFKHKCWKGALNKGIDFFFTITPSGEATEIAWFPKDRAAKCIKRHIESIEFPQPSETHYSWLAVTNIDQQFL
jgi:hypothetical protein